MLAALVADTPRTDPRRNPGADRDGLMRGRRKTHSVAAGLPRGDPRGAKVIDGAAKLYPPTTPLDRQQTRTHGKLTAELGRTGGAWKHQRANRGGEWQANRPPITPRFSTIATSGLPGHFGERIGIGRNNLRTTQNLKKVPRHTSPRDRGRLDTADAIGNAGQRAGTFTA